MRPIAIDLFAGAGGLSLGFEQAGFDIAAAVEIDPIHCAVHEYNFPLCHTVCGDIAILSGAEIRERAQLGDREVDVVVGGAPCQGFSLIGKRALDDPRNALVSHFVRIVSELQPKYFVFENVKGLTVGGHKRFLTELMDEIERSGYDVVRDYRVLNAAEYGVPQDRRRLFLMGARRGQSLPRYPEPTTRPPRRERNVDTRALPPTPTVRDAIGDLPRIQRRKELLRVDTLRGELGNPSTYATFLRGLDRAPNDYSYPRLHDPTVLTGCLSTEHTELSIRRFRETKQGEVEPVSRFLKLAPKGIANTLRAGTNSDRGAFTSPRPIHPNEPRCITNREAARLHSYPDWFRLHVTKWHGFRQIGNSVPPLLARAVGATIIQALGVRPSIPKRALKLGSPVLLQFDASAAANRYGVRQDVNGRRLRPANQA
jgi:DNA (cytosine-5)-methyltransferase 1